MLCLLVLGTSAGWPAVSVTGQSPTPFVDVTAQIGLDFVHVNGAAGELLLPEVIGAGGALFDYDNDGDLDLFAVQGSRLPPPPGFGEARRSASREGGGIRDSTGPEAWSPKPEAWISSPARAAMTAAHRIHAQASKPLAISIRAATNMPDFRPDLTAECPP